MDLYGEIDVLTHVRTQTAALESVAARTASITVHATQTAYLDDIQIL